MLLRQMRYFLAVAECQSFSEAAEQCYISQSAISQQIKILEEDLGTELILRGNRRFQLTEAGEFFYNRSRAIVQEADTLREQLQELAQKKGRRVRLGCPLGAELTAIYQAVNRFLDEHRRTRVELVLGTHDELMQALRNNELELVLSTLRHADEPEEFGTLPVREVPLAVAVSQRSEVALRSSLELKELSKLPCIVIADERQQEKESQHYRRVLHLDSGCVCARDWQRACTLLLNNAGYLPLAFPGTLSASMSELVNVLPITKQEQPITVPYYLFYNKEAAKKDTLKLATELLPLLQ